MDRFSLPAVIALILALAATGCASHAVRTGPQAGSLPVIIEPMDAAAELLEERLIALLDLRLPEDRARIRVRGSKPVEFRAWQQKLRRDPGDPAFAAEWRDDLAYLGIGQATPVRILAGRGDYVDAAVVWYALQGIGIVNVAVVNGGFDGLAEILPGRLLDWLPEAPGAVPPPGDGATLTEPGSSPVHSAQIYRDQLLAVSTGSPILLDTRTVPEFTGRGDRRNPRTGCIPGALNLSHTQLVDEGGRIRPSAEIIRIMADLGAGPDDPLVLYCQSGGRSSFVAMVLVHAGFRDLRNYVGSFAEWSRDEDCPVEADPLKRR